MWNVVMFMDRDVVALHRAERSEPDRKGERDAASLRNVRCTWVLGCWRVSAGKNVAAAGARGI